LHGAGLPILDFLHTPVDLMTRPATFTQAQVRKAIKGAESAGLRVGSITVKPDGSIVIENGDVDSRPTKRHSKALAGWEDV